ncbi:MAG: hypothetical protein QW794_01735 [Thermosphaera sp.]
MTQIQSEEWVEIKFFVPASWKRKLEEVSKQRGYRTLSEFLREVVRKLVEAESR